MRTFAHNLAGLRFGKLSAVTRLGNDKHGRATWLCICDCGEHKRVVAGNLKSGGSQSCGCETVIATRRHSTKHGHATAGLSTEYKRWKSMKDRCLNPNQDSYPLYGGRGITICDRWLDNFQAFITDMGPIPSPKHTLERKDNELGYSPDNCVWATALEQANNKRSNRLITVDGASYTLAQAARAFGIPASRLKDRLRRGWSKERALERTGAAA